MKFLKLLLLIISTNLVYSNENEFEKFLSKLYQNYSSTKNKISIGLSSGIANFNEESISQDFSNLTPVAIEYGFSRYIDKIFYKNYKYFSNEYTFYEHGNILDVANQVNGLRPLSFGFSWNDGYSYQINSMNLIFLHDRGVAWTKLRSPINSDFVNKYNFNWRFGSRFSSGLSLEYSNNYFIDILYSKNVIQPGFEVEYFLAFGLEYLLARFPFYIESNINSIFGSYTPVLIWIYKSALTYLVLNQRAFEKNWPLESGQNLLNEGFKFRLRFTFTD